MRVLVLMLLAGLILGCAPKAVPLTEESMNECERLVKMTERIYLDKTPEEALAAAARLFQLTGGGYDVARTADGLSARRAWSPVASVWGGKSEGVSRSGSDSWQLVAKEVNVCVGGPSMGIIEAVEGDPNWEVRGRVNDCGAVVKATKLAVYHIPEIYSQGLIPTECFSAPVFRPAVSRFTTTPALYDLFFLRMDYLLGKSGRWPSCASYGEYVRNNIYYRDQFSMLNFQGHLDGLCVQVQDSIP